MNLRAIGISVGVVALTLAGGWYWKSRAEPDWSQFKVTDVDRRDVDRIYVHLGNPGAFAWGPEYEIMVVDGEDRTLASRTLTARYSTSIMVPRGFRSDDGILKVQLRKGRTVVAEASTIAESEPSKFSTAASKVAKAWIDRNQLVVEYRDRSVEIGDIIQVIPIMSDYLIYPARHELPMKRVKDGVFTASIQQAYPDNVTRFQFQIKHIKFQPDEFTVSSATLFERDRKVVFSIGVDQKVKTRNGRTMSVPKQQSVSVAGYRTADFKCEVVEGYYSDRRALPELVLPAPQLLGLDQFRVHLRWSESIPILSAGGGGGFAWPLERPGYPATPLKTGDLGRLTIRMYQSDYPKMYVHEFAVPVDPKPPSQPGPALK
jgi:hypothetical protein